MLLVVDLTLVGLVRMMAALFSALTVFCNSGAATLGSGTQDKDSYIQLETWATGH